MATNACCRGTGVEAEEDAWPHPMIIAFWPSYVEGSVAAGGKQTDPTVLENTTGMSNVRMAMSLA